jgi:hypothetical protein
MEYKSRVEPIDNKLEEQSKDLKKEKEEVMNELKK